MYLLLHLFVLYVFQCWFISVYMYMYLLPYLFIDAYIYLISHFSTSIRGSTTWKWLKSWAKILRWLVDALDRHVHAIQVCAITAIFLKNNIWKYKAIFLVNCYLNKVCLINMFIVAIQLHFLCRADGTESGTVYF